MSPFRFIALVAFSATTLYASDDVLQKFHGAYRGLRTISFTFSGGGTSAGKMIAKRGGQYRVVLGDRTVVSNGAVVWNAAASTKTVIVSDYKPSSTDVSIERVFFDVMSVYRSSVLSSNNGVTVIRLEAPNAQAQIAGITKVDLTCNSTLVVSRVSITSQGSSSTFTISKVSINGKVPESTFTYNVPKGWQIVDIR